MTPINISVCVLTLIPVLVASFTAAMRLSYLGLKANVYAQSIMRPAKLIGKHEQNALLMAILHVLES